ncbi:hypothetical protein, partial [Aeromicrobium sp. Leaf272]
MAGLRERLARRIWTPPPPPKPPRDPELVALDRLRDAWKDGPVRDDRINEHLALVLDKSGVPGGRVLEIGGRGHPRHRVFDADRFEYLNLDL